MTQDETLMQAFDRLIKEAENNLRIAEERDNKVHYPEDCPNCDIRDIFVATLGDLRSLRDLLLEKSEEFEDEINSESTTTQEGGYGDDHINPDEAIRLHRETIGEAKP